MGLRPIPPAALVGLLVGVLLVARPAHAAEPVIVGSVGSNSANAWPVHIGLRQGFFAAEGLDVDFIYAQSNAAVIQPLTAPFNFYAESAGFANLGFAFDYVKDMPFAGMAVNRAWAQANPKVVERFVAVFVKSIAWFEDRRNRDEAVRMMVELSKLKTE